MAHYLGNAVDVPPIGGWTRLGSNPVIAPPTYGMPENIVFDPVTNKYWSPITNFTTVDVGLVSSPDLLTWTLDPFLLGLTDGGNAGSPHLLLSGGVWYLYYCKYVAGVISIYLATSSTVNGTYTHVSTPLISPTGTGWEKDRVLEPFVFQDQAGRWVMFYMGDKFYTDPVYGANSSAESVGYAYATSPAGPFTRYAGNPVIPMGSAGQFDVGGTADPHVYYFNGLYYIFYAYVTNLPTIVTQFRYGYTGYSTSPDLINFTKRGLAFGPSGVPGTPDEWSAVRGGIIRKVDTYYFIYAGRTSGSGSPVPYTVCIATMPAKAPNFLING